MGFSIELAENRDAPVIREVYDQAIQHANSVGMIDWPSPFPENTIKNFCISNELFVVRADDAEQGIVAAFRLTEEPNPRIWDDRKKELKNRSNKRYLLTQPIVPNLWTLL